MLHMPRANFESAVIDPQTEWTRRRLQILLGGGAVEAVRALALPRLTPLRFESFEGGLVGQGGVRHRKLASLWAAPCRKVKVPECEVGVQCTGVRTEAGCGAGPRSSCGCRGYAAVVSEGMRDAAGSSSSLPGTDPGTLKVAPYEEYPPKGRATGGVRAHRFLRGEDALVLAWAGAASARASASNGVAVPLPEPTGKRDGSGVASSTVIAGIAGPSPWAGVEPAGE